MLLTESLAVKSLWIPSRCVCGFLAVKNCMEWLSFLQTDISNGGKARQSAKYGKYPK